MELISPYIFPLCHFERLDPEKYPYAKKYSKVTSKEVIEAISEEYEISPDFILATRRTRKCVDARMAVCFILHTYFNWTLKEIGSLLGGRDHTTVVYNREMFRKLYFSDQDYKDRADRVLKKIGLNFLKKVA